MNENLRFYGKTYVLIVFLIGCIIIRYSDIDELFLKNQSKRKRFFIIYENSVEAVENIKKTEDTSAQKKVEKETKPELKQKTEKEVIEQKEKTKEKTPVNVIKPNVCIEVLVTGLSQNKKLTEYSWDNLPKKSYLGFVPSFSHEEIIELYNTTQKGFRVAIAAPLSEYQSKPPYSKLYIAIEKILENYASIGSALYGNAKDVSVDDPVFIEEVKVHLLQRDLKLFLIGNSKITTDNKIFIIPDVYFEPGTDRSQMSNQLSHIMEGFISGKSKILLSAHASFDSIELIADFIAKVKQRYEIVCN